MRILYLALFFLIIPRSSWAQKVFFDHQIITVSAQSFTSLRSIFVDQKLQNKTGMRWVDGSKMKGFLSFDDNSYIEVWNADEFSKYGFQEAWRVTERNVLEEFAHQYGVKVADFSDPLTHNLATVGRRGVVGDPNGGMFFIWGSSAVTLPNENGIEHIVKAVVAEKDGIKPEIAADYRLANLELKFHRNKSVLVATDYLGFKVTAVSGKGASGTGLISVSFSRNGGETEKIFLYSDRKSHAYLDLLPGRGKLIFRSDMHERCSILMDL